MVLSFGDCEIDLDRFEVRRCGSTVPVGRSVTTARRSGSSARSTDGATHPALLTPREQEVADLARQGLSNPEIAERLFVSTRTVDNHLRRVYAGLGIGGRHEL
jgi:DNA-binding NarL/FixJ family response regulator